MDKKRVLLTYIESGMGHITSIQSITDNLRKYYGDEFELVESYIMQEDGDKSLKAFENFIIKQTKNTNRIKGFGNFVFWFLDLMGKVKFMRAVHRTAFRKFTNHCLDAFKKRDPDVIVSTHYFLTFAGLEYKKKVNPNVKVITYNPDNNVHCWWDNRDHLFLVNNEAAYLEAIGKRKFNPSMVKQVNYIAREDILKANLTREEYREKLGITQNKFCVMVADGVYACAKAKKVTDQLLKSDKEMTIVFLAGKNKKLFNYYSKLIKDGKVKKNITLIVLPFTKTVYEYYKAADVFVTKAGPNAVLDSVFMGTPVLVDYYAHPIEKATTKLFVDKLQMGKAIYKPKKIKKQIEAWIDDKTELLKFEENTAKIDKFENGGEEAARLIKEECEREECFVSKSHYTNTCFSLAKQGRCNDFTTPINYNNMRKKVDYEKFEKPGFLARVAKFFVKPLLFLLGPVINFFGFGIRIKGRKNLKGVKTAVTVSNHINKLDCLWLMQTLQGEKLYITVAPHNYKKGFAGSVLKAGGVIPMPTTLKQNRAFDGMVERLLKKKLFLHFYPEEAMWTNWRQSRPFKRGAFLYASKNNVPVVPIIYCFRGKRGSRGLTVQICKPIYPQENVSIKENSLYLQNEAQKVYDETIINFYGYNKETYSMNEYQQENKN